MYNNIVYVQEWFMVGKMPFVGVIVNPFSSDKPRIESDVRCLVISKPDKSTSSQLGKTSNATLFFEVVNV